MPIIRLLLGGGLCPPHVGAFGADAGALGPGPYMPFRALYKGFIRSPHRRYEEWSAFGYALNPLVYSVQMLEAGLEKGLQNAFRRCLKRLYTAF